MNYLVLELHKQEPWYSIKIVCFKPLPLIGVNAWRKYNCRSSSENLPRRTLLGIEKKKKKTYTKVLPESSELYVNNDDIGICKIWRNDSKSPIWITEWKQRRSSTMKEIEEMSLVAVVGGRKGFILSHLTWKSFFYLLLWNNRGNITQIQKETAYLPPSSSLLRESIVKILQEN